MSTPINDGGPAFPLKFQELDGQGNPRSALVFHYGMTLRDWFAGQALAGMFADDSRSKMNEHAIAHDAYLFADAMLAARNKEGAK